jgi:hypothetical protein
MLLIRNNDKPVKMSIIEPFVKGKNNFIAKKNRSPNIIATER